MFKELNKIKLKGLFTWSEGDPGTMQDHPGRANFSFIYFFTKHTDVFRDDLIKKGKLINGTETTIFVKYPIFRKTQPFFFRVLQIITIACRRLALVDFLTSISLMSITSRISLKGSF